MYIHMYLLSANRPITQVITIKCQSSHIHIYVYTTIYTYISTYT